MPTCRGINQGHRSGVRPGGDQVGYRIAPGHDAWVEGDEAVVAYEFNSAGSYAKA